MGVGEAGAISENNISNFLSAFEGLISRGASEKILPPIQEVTQGAQPLTSAISSR